MNYIIYILRAIYICLDVFRNNKCNIGYKHKASSKEVSNGCTHTVCRAIYKYATLGAE
jgi:hypothetical protein